MQFYKQLFFLYTNVVCSEKKNILLLYYFIRLFSHYFVNLKKTHIMAVPENEQRCYKHDSTRPLSVTKIEQTDVLVCIVGKQETGDIC